jgi:hypothetical protein
MAHRFTTSYIEDSLALLGQYKTLAEKAFAQLTDGELNRQLDRESNSICQIVKHIAGNMRSRWTDFLTSDGEKPDRDRDSEFIAAPLTREEMSKLWNEGWSILFAALEPLSGEDLGRTITIRAEPHSVMQAINRQIAHYSLHIGQIIFIAKHLRSSEWTTLSVPKNRSAEFTANVVSGEASQR